MLYLDKYRLKSKNPEVSKKAAIKLAQSGKQRIINYFVSIIKKENSPEHIYHSILYSLGIIGDKKALNILFDKLTDDGGLTTFIGDDEKVAVQGIMNAENKKIIEYMINSTPIHFLEKLKILYEISQERNLISIINEKNIKTITKDSDIHKKLIECIDNKDINIKSEAIYLTGNLKIKSALESLHMAIKDDNPEIREATAYALGEIESPKSINHVAFVLDDNDPDVRLEAIKAIGKIPCSQSIEALIPLLEDDSWDVCETVANTLKNLNWKPKNLTHQAIIAIIAKNWKVLHKLGKASIGPLFIKFKHTFNKDNFDEYWRDKKQIIDIIGEIGDEKFVEPLLKLIVKDSSTIYLGFPVDDKREISISNSIEKIMSRNIERISINNLLIAYSIKDKIALYEVNAGYEEKPWDTKEIKIPIDFSKIRKIALKELNRRDINKKLFEELSGK